MIDAILPAGGRIDGDFANKAGAHIKALISLNGVTLLQHTIEALRQTNRIGRIAVIGATELAEHNAARGADAVLAEGASGIDNLYRGIEWTRQQHNGTLPERVLVLTTDLPYITAQAVTDFVERCDREAAVNLPVIARQPFDARFPGSVNEFVVLKDGQWTMGCAFMLQPQALIQHQPTLQRVFAARKSQLGMARLLGPVFIARFLARQLTIAHIEQRCERLLGCKGHAVMDCAPELAFDIDLPVEYEYARQLPRDR